MRLECAALRRFHWLLPASDHARARIMRSSFWHNARTARFASVHPRSAGSYKTLRARNSVRMRNSSRIGEFGSRLLTWTRSEEWMKRFSPK